VAAELATTPFDSTMARTVSSTDEHHGRLRRNPLPMGPGERVPLVALHRKGNLCRHGVILAMYGKSIRGLTLEGADSHGTQSRGSRPPPHQWKDEHVQNRLRLPPTAAAWAPIRHQLPAMHSPSRSDSKITSTMSIALITERAPASPSSGVCPSVDSLMLSQGCDQQYQSDDLAGCDRRDQDGE
jgi:hypothetical protein